MTSCSAYLYHRVQSKLTGHYTHLPFAPGLRCVPLGWETRVSQLVFSSRKLGCSQNSEFST